MFLKKIALRKQARQLENEIDSKLVSFSKLCSNYTASLVTSPSAYSNRSSTSSPSGPPQNNASSSDLLFMTLSNELEDLIKKLTNINTKMSENLGAENGVNSNATVHTLQVYLENIFQFLFSYYKFNF